MNCGDAIRTVRANNCQVRHADFALGALFDNAYASHATVIAGEAKSNLVEKNAG